MTCEEKLVECVEALKLCKANLSTLLTPLSGSDWRLATLTIHAIKDALALVEADKV